MSNTRRSKAEVASKRFGRQAEQYQAHIDRQVHAIDRLAAAVAVYGDLTYGVQHEAKNIKEARKWAKEAQAKVEAILAVPKEDK